MENTKQLKELSLDEMLDLTSSEWENYLLTASYDEILELIVYFSNQTSIAHKTTASLIVKSLWVMAKEGQEIKNEK